MNRYLCFNLLKLQILVALTISRGYVSLAAELQVSPPEVTLDRPEASQQLIIWQTGNGDRSIDLTREAILRVEPASVATVDERGLLRPLENGSATLSITVGDLQTAIPISVSRMDGPEKISFQHEIIPILTKARCNSGGCQGKRKAKTDSNSAFLVSMLNPIMTQSLAKVVGDVSHRLIR